MGLHATLYIIKLNSLIVSFVGSRFHCIYVLQGCHSDVMSLYILITGLGMLLIEKSQTCVQKKAVVRYEKYCKSFDLSD
jgi:hypothetical protein